MSTNPERLKQIEKKLPSAAKLALQVIDDLALEEQALVRTYLETKWPGFRTDLATSKDSANQSHFLTAKEVAIRVGCDEVTIRNYARRGSLSATRAGKTWLIPETALDIFETKKVGRPRKIR